MYLLGLSILGRPGFLVSLASFGAESSGGVVLRVGAGSEEWKMLVILSVKAVIAKVGVSLSLVVDKCKSPLPLFVKTWVSHFCPGWLDLAHLITKLPKTDVDPNDARDMSI